MALYRITFLSANGTIERQAAAEYRDDDQAIDEVGRGFHPHGIRVHQGERLVGDFLPLGKLGRR